MTGCKSEDHKRKISEALKGHSVSEETRRKLSVAHRGRIPTEEHRRKNAEGVARAARERRQSQREKELYDEAHTWRYTDRWSPESENEIVWLAGLLEGEGCFTTQRQRGKPYLKIIVVMTDRDVVEHVARLFGTSVGEKKPKNGGKQLYGTTVAGAKARWLMERVYPWLGERRRVKIDELMERCAPTRKKLHPWDVGEGVMFGVA